MTAQIIDGRRIAADIQAELKKQILQLQAQGIVPGLGVILVGADPASQSYVLAKGKACRNIGIHSVDQRLPATITASELNAHIQRMNADPRLHGILVQLPLPGHLSAAEILLAIDPQKDVDGFHPLNVGRLLLGQETFWPCTPHGVIQLLVRSGVQLSGAHVVVVGRSAIVGKPLANILAQKTSSTNATVTLCHTGTRDIGYFTRQADVIVAALGRPRAITADMVKEGAVVIDVGINRIPDASRSSGWRLVGDVDFDTVQHKASLITPVPGGVGPMTIAMLLYNTVISAQRRASAGHPLSAGSAPS